MNLDPIFQRLTLAMRFLAALGMTKPFSRYVRLDLNRKTL